jgi:hypothetical protein
MTVVKSDIDKWLLALLGRQELVEQWWTGSNYHFGFKTPLEVYQGTDEQRESVIGYVRSFVQGDYS